RTDRRRRPRSARRALARRLRPTAVPRPGPRHRPRRLEGQTRRTGPRSATVSGSLLDGRRAPAPNHDVPPEAERPLWHRRVEDEPAQALLVGKAAARAREVGVERRRVVVRGVDVAPRRVRLPDLDERVADRAAVRVGDAAAEDDPLAKGLAGVLAGEVGVFGGYGQTPKGRSARAVEPLVRQPYRLTRGRAQLGGA